MEPQRQSHDEIVVEQFTKQAEAYSTAPALAAEDSLRLLVTLAGAGAGDAVLDVACGPGYVACAFAPLVASVTGIDLTPAMIERAEALGRAKGLSNVTWRIGGVRPLPFPAASFSIVVSRYALHHMEEPRAAVAEMARVARPGGRVLVADVHVSPDRERAARYDRMEKLRDPSHVRALPLAELEEVVRDAGLRQVDATFHGVEFEVESLLQGSRPEPAAAREVRRMLVEEVAASRMGLRAWRQGDEVRFVYPIVAILARKEAPGQ